MTVSFPDGVATAGNEAVWFVPAIKDVTKPAITELTAGHPLQCAITTFSTGADQGTVEDVRLCSTETYGSPGSISYKVDPLEYVYDPQKPEDVAKYGYYAAMKPNTPGFMVDRRGIPHGTPFKAGDVVDIYPITMGAQTRVPVEGGDKGGGKFKTRQQMFISGPVQYDVKVVA